MLKKWMKYWKSLLNDNKKQYYFALKVFNTFTYLINSLTI